MAKEKEWTIQITAKDLETSIVESNRAIDVLAVACDRFTENQLWEYNIDYSEQGFDQILKEFDYEEAFIEALNANPILLNDYVVDPRAVPYTTFDKVYAESKTDLLAGAWFALEQKEAFEQSLDDWTNKIKSEVSENSYESDDIPAKLKEALQKEEQWFWENLQHEWLYGDRSDGGLLYAASKKYATKVRVDMTNDIIFFDLNEDDAGELMSSYGSDYDNEIKITPKLLKATLVSAITGDSNRVHNKEEEDKKKRREENERTRQYKKQQAEKAEAERIAKLKAMKKGK